MFLRLSREEFKIFRKVTHFQAYNHSLYTHADLTALSNNFPLACFLSPHWHKGLNMFKILENTV